MARRRALWAAALSLVPASGGLAVTGALADTGASAAATTAGCGKAPGLASGTQTLQSGGKSRTFVLKVPGGYDNTRPYRLIFAFHWWGGTANEVASGGTSGSPWAYHGQQKLSDNSAILVAPQGIDYAWPNNGGEDTAFVDAMVSRNNGCTTQNPREPAAGSRTHITTEYTGCRAGYPVVWAAFDGGHLPGAVDGYDCESGVRTWTKGEVRTFFSRFQGTSPTPTTTNTTASTIHQGQRCQVEYRTNAWNSGLTSEIVITNTGTHVYTGWDLVFTLPSGQTITSGWNASYSPTSGQVTAKNASYNGEIVANASVSLGFQASHTGDTAKPTYFVLNGAVCSNA